MHKLTKLVLQTTTLIVFLISHNNWAVFSHEKKPKPVVVKPVAVATQATDFFQTPAVQGEADIVKFISNANKSIKMWMFNLTNKTVIQALIDAAKKPNVKVQLILNADMFSDQQDQDGDGDLKSKKDVPTMLTQAGVEVVKGSEAFSINHAKTTLIDDQQAWITTMNLTHHFLEQRDAGVLVQDQSVIADLIALFEADLQNAKTQGSITPVQQSKSLLVSPTNSLDQIESLIDQAQKEILITSENISLGLIQPSLQRALKRNVSVKVIAPLCDLNFDPFFNLPTLRSLNALGVKSLVMPFPASKDLPYLHQKSMIIDQKILYVGSQNFTRNSLKKAREIGIIINNPEIVNQFLESQNHDFNVGVSVPEINPEKCSSF